MTLQYFQLLIDFGLVVLIWMVQLLIYPSFLFYEQKGLINWHKKYTSRLSFIVIPLMFAQLIIVIYKVLTVFNVVSTINGIVVLALWIITFSKFVPLHSAIALGESNKKILLTLVHKNWYRTALWTFLFLFNLFLFTTDL